MNTIRKVAISVNKIFDLSVLVLAFALATYITLHDRYPAITAAQILEAQIKIQNIMAGVLLVFSWWFIFRCSGIYRSRRIEVRGKEIFEIVMVTTTAMLTAVAVGFVFDLAPVDKSFLLVFWALSTSTLIASRIMLRLLLVSLRRRGINTRHMIIIGTGKRALAFAHSVTENPELGYHIIGFIDNKWKGIDSFSGNGWRLLGSIKDFPDLLLRNVVDEVVISLPVKSYYDQINEIISICEEQGIIVRFLSDLFDLTRSKVNIDWVSDVPCITLYSAPIEYLPLLVKRIIDVTVASALLILLLPILLLTALLIKLDSPGPVFFIQRRMGLNKRIFKLLKFRTMIENAEKMQASLLSRNEVTGPVFKIKNDPRLTRIGKWLRITSIDELPQLINVVRGDMSLVGPRPPIPTEVTRYALKDRRRLSIKPGITCLWQINGRSNVPFEQWMELDQEYIDNWSLWLDFKILAKTIPAVIRGAGAV